MTIDRIIDPTTLVRIVDARERHKEEQNEDEEVKKKYLDVRVRGHSGFLGRRFDLVDFHFCVSRGSVSSSKRLSRSEWRK